MLENERVFDFLHELNKDLDEVSDQLLGSKPFPSILEAFAKIKREESCKKVMLNNSSPQIQDIGIQNSALVVH